MSKVPPTVTDLLLEWVQQRQLIEDLQAFTIDQRLEIDRLRAALVLMVETFGPISDVSAAGASQPAIEQAREALGRDSSGNVQS